MVSTHIYVVSKEIDGKTFIFLSKDRHVTPQVVRLVKNEPCSEGFNRYLWGFQGDRWESIHLAIKPRHVTFQIDHLIKTSPVQRVSTYIYGVSKEIDGKTFILQLNLGM